MEQGTDYLVLRERTHGRGPEYVLRGAGVEVEMTEWERLADALQELGVQAVPTTIPGQLPGQQGRTQGDRCTAHEEVSS